MAGDAAGDQGVFLVIFASPSSTSCTASKPSIRFDISSVGVTRVPRCYPDTRRPASVWPLSSMDSGKAPY